MASKKHSQDPEKRIRVALSGADVIAVEYVPVRLMAEVRVEVLQTHKDFRSDGGGLEPEVVWPQDPQNPRLALINKYIEYHGEGRQEDMALDLEDPAQFLLVQTSPGDGEPWYTLLSSIEDGVQVLRQDEEPWNFEVLVDLDTGEEFNLVTEYSFESSERPGMTPEMEWATQTQHDTPQGYTGQRAREKDST